MSSTPTFPLLLALAVEQGGYFTAQQARLVGYAYDDQHYQVRVGHWQRVARGLYRLAGFPVPEAWDLIELTLQSADRSGIPALIFSHETALRLHELSDINPAQLQATVPPGFRKRLPGVQLQFARLAEDDWEQRDGYRVTTPLRTLLDIAASSTSWPFLPEAVRQALARGLVRRRQLEQAPGSTRRRAQLRRALRSLDQAPPERVQGAS